MSKYIVKTPVEAVLLLDKNAASIQGIADMLPGVPHMFTNVGLVFPNLDTEAKAETIPYGNYIIKENHGISAMAKELFESVSTQEDIPQYDSLNFRNNVLTIGKLKDYLNQLPETLMNKEVWLGGSDGLSNECYTVTPLDRRDDSFDIILEARPSKDADYMEGDGS